MVAGPNPKVGGITMTSASVSSFRQKVAERDGFLTPALAVSIVIAIFAVVTQFLAATGAISLSTTQQLTVWLVAAGFIVLLWIAYMAAEAQARLAAALVAADPPNDPVLKPVGPQPPEPSIDGSGSPKPVASESGNAGHGNASALRKCPRVPVNMADVFPQGCRLVPDSISETYYYDEKTETVRPAIDKITCKRVYHCRVVHTDPQLKGEPQRTVVTIVADQMPVPPTGAPWEPVEFEGLTAKPYATDCGRAAYNSLRATGIKQPVAPPPPGNGQVPASVVPGGEGQE